MELLDTQLTQLNTIYNDYQKICEMLNFEEVVLDSKLCQKLEKDRAKVSLIVSKFELYQKTVKDKSEFENILLTSSKEEQTLIQKELDNLTEQISSLSLELSNLLKEQNAENSNILVLVQHNNDYTSETLQKLILCGYQEFCKVHNLQVTMSENKNTTELKITGHSAKEFFETEKGVHKAVIEGETSHCLVYVLDHPTEEEISFEEKDIKVQTCRSSGAGGQHINTTDSAIKVTHLKSGISTICQSERSQFQNRVQALEQLKEKVIAFYDQKHNECITNQRTKQYKSLNLKDEVKLYNYNTKTIISKNSNNLTFDNFLKGKQL